MSVREHPHSYYRDSGAGCQLPVPLKRPKRPPETDRSSGPPKLAIKIDLVGWSNLVGRASVLLLLLFVGMSLFFLVFCQSLSVLARFSLGLARFCNVFLALLKGNSFLFREGLLCFLLGVAMLLGFAKLV